MAYNMPYQRVHTRPMREMSTQRWVARVAHLELMLEYMDVQDAIEALSRVYAYSTVQLPK